MPDEKIIVGGPGDVTPPVTTPPVAAPVATTAKVSIGGVEYEVSAQLADSLRRDRDRVAGEFGSRVQAYERRIGALEAAGEPEPEQSSGLRPPDPRDMQFDPEKFARDNLAYTNALVASSVQAVEERRANEREAEQRQLAKNRAWATHVDQFYQDHPEFKGDEDIVDTVWQRNFARLGQMDLQDGFSELAKLSAARIVAVAEKGRALNKPVHLETSRGSRRTTPNARETEDQGPNIRGISDAIRAKQARFKMPYAKAAVA